MKKRGTYFNHSTPLNYTFSNFFECPANFYWYGQLLIHWNTLITLLRPPASNRRAARRARSWKPEAMLPAAHHTAAVGAREVIKVVPLELQWTTLYYPVGYFQSFDKILMVDPISIYVVIGSDWFLSSIIVLHHSVYSILYTHQASSRNVDIYFRAANAKRLLSCR